MRKRNKVKREGTKKRKDEMRKERGGAAALGDRKRGTIQGGERGEYKGELVRVGGLVGEIERQVRGGER